jgi:hypothetical protein
MGECAAIIKWNNIIVRWGKCLRTEVVRLNGLAMKWGMYKYANAMEHTELSATISQENRACINIHEYDGTYGK